MSCSLPPEVLRYIELVEADTPRACPEQHALVALVRRVFETEDIYVDTEKLRKYLGLAKYFSFGELLPWEEFITALWDCTYTVNPTLSGNTYSAAVELSGLDYQKSFTIEVVAADAIDSLTKTAPIEQGIPHVDMGLDHFRINALLRLAEANHGTQLPATGMKDQIFLLYTNGSWTIKIHDGTSWT